jgi:hypothetical protein
MALVLADRVKETTTTAGTGTVTLLGASAGFQSFAVIGDANTTYYTIAAQTGTEWEVGIGTYTSSGTTLARTTVLSNSAGTQPSALSFSAGTKDVFVTYPSSKSVNLDASGNATALGTPAAFVGTNITGTASGLTAGNVTTNANLTGDVTSVGNATTLATVNSNVGSFTLASITVNAKGLITAASSGSAPSDIPSGSVLLFYQASAPTGWTKVTTAGLDDSALRIVTGTGGTTGGSVAFTTAFASQTPTGAVSVGVSAGTLAVGVGTLSTNNTTAGGTNSSGSVSSHTLATSEMPSHNHTTTFIARGSNVFANAGIPGLATDNNTITYTSSSTGGGGGHSHSFTQPTFTGSAHNHTMAGSPTLSGSPSITSATFTGNAINLAVKYVNIILCSKN